MHQYHYTSLNVHRSTMELIEYISFLTGLSNNMIILMVLNRFSRECRGVKPRHFKQVKYQEQDPGNYEAISLKLPVEAYEFFKDIRHIFRGSAALLIAIALRMYLKLFIDGKMDSPVFLFHSFVGFFINGQQIWVQHWGEKPKKFNFSNNCLPVFD